MSRGLIILIIVIGVLLVLGYVVAVLLRKRNEALLASLEERKEELYNLPVNDEVEAVKNMHLIGQSQVAFREWNQKWVDLSLNSFADIENNLFEAEGYNNSFRFLKAKQAIGNIESQVQLIDEDIKAIRQALSELKEKKDYVAYVSTLDYCISDILENFKTNIDYYCKNILEDLEQKKIIF